MKKRSMWLAAGLAAVVLAIVMDAGGWQLARPERSAPQEDTWVGFHLVWERLPGEGEEIPLDREHWVEYGSQTVEAQGIGTLELPREILIGTYDRDTGFTFPGLEGYNAFLAEVEEEDGSKVLTGNELFQSKINVGTEENSISGTIYYGLPLGETQWPADGSDYGWTAYNVYQMPDGTVYLDGSGNSYGGAEGGMSISSQRTSTKTINGESETTTLSVEVTFETVGRLEQVEVKQFGVSDEVVGQAVFPIGQMSEETAVTLEEQAQWVLVTERYEDGSVKRTVYDRQEISFADELMHTLVVLDDQGKGQQRWLLFGEKKADFAAAQ